MIWLLKLIYPFLKLAGKIHLPYTHKKVTGYHYYDLQTIIEPGDILVAHTSGEFTNWLIPGFWKHAAIYTGTGTIVEAVGEGVRQSHLVSFMLTKDYVRVMRPKFLTPAQKLTACVVARSQIGKPYDYYLKSGIEAFYCAELPWFAMMKACLPDKCPFEMRNRFGELTVTPEDYVGPSDKFFILWSSIQQVSRRPK